MALCLELLVLAIFIPPTLISADASINAGLVLNCKVSQQKCSDIMFSFTGVQFRFPLCPFLNEPFWWQVAVSAAAAAGLLPPSTFSFASAGGVNVVDIKM